MKIKEKIVSIVFIIFLISPTLIFWLVGNKVDNTNYENRILAGKPIFLRNNWKKYPKAFDAYIDDHAAFKNQFVKLNNFIDFKLFNTTSSEKVLVGKNQWLFYKYKNEGDPIGSYQGINRYTSKELETIKNNLVEIKNKLNKENKEFILFVAPNKEEIYSEFMPSSIRVVNEYKSIDEMVDYIINNTDIKVIYPKEELLNVKEKYQVYHKYDTHWNDIGAFIGSQQLNEKLTGKRKYIEDIQVTLNGVQKNDLAFMISLKNYLKEDNTQTISGYNPNINVKQIYSSDKVGSRINKFQSNAEDTRKIMIIRDSFSLAMYPYIPREFQNTVFINKADFKNEFLRKENPDIVVYQVVERFSYLLLDQINELNK